MDKNMLENMISDYLDGTIKPEDIKRLKSVLKKSPKAREIFQKMAGQEMALYQINYNTDILGSLEKRLNLKKPRLLPRWIAIAASILLISAVLLPTFCCSTQGAKDEGEAPKAGKNIVQNDEKTQMPEKKTDGGAKVPEKTEPKAGQQGTSNTIGTQGTYVADSMKGTQSQHVSNTTKDAAKIPDKPVQKEPVITKNPQEGSHSVSGTPKPPVPDAKPIEDGKGSGKTEGMAKTTDTGTVNQNDLKNKTDEGGMSTHSVVKNTSEVKGTTDAGTSSNIQTPPTKEVGYKVIVGDVEPAQFSDGFNPSGVKTVIRATKPDTQLLLPDESNVILQPGTNFGVMEGDNRYGVDNGEAKFEVKKKSSTPASSSSFTVTTRIGEVDILGTVFKLTIEEIKGAAGVKPGDSPAKMEVEVMRGKVGVLKFGAKQKVIVQAGQKQLFYLGAVMRDGTIQAVGFGKADPKFRGGQAKLMRERAAYDSALASLTEFGSGMSFSIPLPYDGGPIKDATFKSEGKIQLLNIGKDYSDIEENLTLCIAKSKISMNQAVLRRNLEVRKATGTCSLSTYNNNSAMALVGARNVAILKLIEDAAHEAYGESLPTTLTGVCYPLSFTVEKEGDNLTATITGHVLFK